jgi:uncharacterized protein YggU (UPF0235/DUF167 family)
MLRLTVAVHPGAREDGVSFSEDGTLAVSVRARPVDGQANTAVERTLAAALGLRPRQVRIVVGATSRRKIVEIDLPGRDVLRDRLRAHSVRHS